MGAHRTQIRIPTREGMPVDPEKDEEKFFLIFSSSTWSLVGLRSPASEAVMKTHFHLGPHLFLSLLALSCAT